jgi:TctA family transporter
MSFGLYALGYLVVIIGVAYMAHLMHIPQHWVVAIVLVLFGIGIVTGVQSTRQKDPN